ncbi:MAG: hypothetical protein AB1918_15050 [Pseudomonadota bacterium]
MTILIVLPALFLAGIALGMGLFAGVQLGARFFGPVVVKVTTTSHGADTV